MTEPTRQTAAQHLAALERSHRRAHGKVYTPDALADFVVAQALGSERGLRGTVLDPACGAGVFLVSLVAHIARKVSHLGVDVRTNGRKRFLAEVKESLWGLDLDPHAVTIARREVREAIEHYSPGPLATDFLDENIVVGNFLDDAVTDFMPCAPSLIVGNPPYVAADRIEEVDKAKYRQSFAAAFGRLDLYTLFMEQAARVLAPGGTWALITPDKFLLSESARPLRQLLAEKGTIRSIGLFDSHRIFEDAATVPCVTVWDKVAPQGHGVRVDRVKIDDDAGRSPVVVETETTPARALQAPQWAFHRKGTESLLQRLSRGHPTLHERTKRISAGWATGYNPAFILDSVTAAQIEPELVHPSVRGRDLQAYAIADRGEHILVPYVWDEDGACKLVDPTAYPRASRWLAKHRSHLSERHCVRKWGKQWWDLHDPVSLPLHRTPKVLVPDLARSNRFAADSGTYVPQHSAYYLVPDGIEEDLLAAMLNSPAVELLIRTQAPLVKDGFSRYRRQFLVTLPVPEVPTDTQSKIREALKSGRHDDVAVLTTDLFGVDIEDINEALGALPKGK